MFLRIALFFFLTAVNLLAAAAPEGIPRDLAQQRAFHISDLQYNLRFTLTPHADVVSGHEELKFRLNLPDRVIRNRPLFPDILLDFREGTVTNLAVNGRPAPVQAENGHITLANSFLRLDANTVSLDF